MLIFTQKEKLQEYLKKSTFKPIGFVPTMGALHQGHINLIQESKLRCRITICSIFVNPTQFNKKKDLKNYPSSYDEDMSKLKHINCDILYLPKVKDIYPSNIVANKYDFEGLDIYMEGEFRPNHFNGVATVIEIFLRIINPDFTFFGEKDLQQLQIIKYLVKNLNLSTKIIGIPTTREENGLAMSSRNNLLNIEEKKIAKEIYKCLLYCKSNTRKGVSELKKYITDKLKKSKKLRLEYIEFVELKTLKPIKKFGSPKSNAVCIAVYIGKVRLIDNIIL